MATPHYTKRAPPAPPSYDEGHNISPSSSSPTAIGNDGHLPTIIFAIPFPTPQRSTKKNPHPTSPYFLYTLPRAPYEKPVKDAYGKKTTKEGLVKKVERKWQGEVAQGYRIRKGQEPNPGLWKKFKGKAVGVADGVIHYLPNSRIEALGRVPPKKKLGQVTVLYPVEASTPDGAPITPEFIQDNISAVLKKTKKRATLNAVGSGLTLPITAAIDFFVIVPIFLFEMNLAYFSTQVSGRSKVSAITDPKHSAIACVPASDLDPMSVALQATCHKLAPKKFDATMGAHRAAPVSREQLLAAADVIIEAFRRQAIDEVAARHVLDREKIADDLRRCFKKASKEYVGSV